MSERFTRVFSCQTDLGVEGTPVLIRAGALSIDTKTQKLIVQLRIKNIGDKAISLVKVKIIPLDPVNRELDEIVEYTYLDLACKTHEEFGAKKPIYIQTPTARAFNVGICEVAFDDGSIWTNDNTSWMPLDKASLTIRAYEAKYRYEKALILKEQENIHSLEEAIKLFESAAEFKKVDELIGECENLINELTQKTEKEAEEQRIKEEEEAERKAQRSKKIKIISIISVSLAILFGLILYKYMLYFGVKK